MQIKQQIKNHKSLVESFFSLSILNGLNVLLPLITLPYILRVVGASNYGVYAFVYALVQYVSLVNTYGFNYSATKQASQCRNEKDQLNKIYNAIIACRLILAFGAIILFLSLSPWLLETRDKMLMFWMGLGIVLGDTFIPVWLFQGVEKMRYLTIINVISKLIFTILIFIVIRETKDYIYIILFNGLGYIVAGICSTIIAKKMFGLDFSMPTWSDIKFQFKDGLAVFGSNIGMNLYRNTNIFILKFFVSDAAVGIYASAEKIIKGLQMAVSPIAQALFPHLSYKFKTLPLGKSIDLLLRVCRKFSVLLLIISGVAFIGADLLTELLCGKGFTDAVSLIRIMSLVILFGGMNYILGIVGLINLNEGKSFFYAVMVSGIASVLFLFLFVSKYGNFAAAWALTLSEILLFILCIYKLYKLKQQGHDESV